MKEWQSTTATGLGALTLLLAITLIGLGLFNQSKQKELGQQQQSFNEGRMSDQIGGALLRDLAGASVNDDKIRNLLSKYGYKVEVKNNAPAATTNP